MEKKKRNLSKQTITVEGWMLKNAEVGDSFFTEKNDRSMTAIAKYYKKKIQTERIIAITGYRLKPSAFSLTKVTIL